MQKILIILIIGLVLSGCVRRIDIEQGNKFDTEMVNQLHTGMTKVQVKEIMGPPLLMNTFNNDRVDYVYTFRCGGGAMTEKYVVLTFRGNVLKEIDRMNV